MRLAFLNHHISTICKFCGPFLCSSTFSPLTCETLLISCMEINRLAFPKYYLQLLIPILSNNFFYRLEVRDKDGKSYFAWVGDMLAKKTRVFLGSILSLTHLSMLFSAIRYESSVESSMIFFSSSSKDPTLKHVKSDLVIHEIDKRLIADRQRSVNSKKFYNIFIFKPVIHHK